MIFYDHCGFNFASSLLAEKEKQRSSSTQNIEKSTGNTGFTVPSVSLSSDAGFVALGKLLHDDKMK